MYLDTRDTTPQKGTPMSMLTTTDLWIDLCQGTTDRATRESERAFGYVGTEEEYEDSDGESLAYCGWFFTWPDARPAKELTDAEIDAMVESLERDETASHRESIPRALVEEVLRAEIEPRKVVVTIYWDAQDAANEGWAARKIGPNGEDTTAIDAEDEDAAKAEAAKHYGVSVEAVTVEE